MNITLIGAGNLATQLGKALVAAGQHVQQVYSRTAISAETLAQALHTEATCDIGAVKDADLYLMAVKDDALPSLIAPLAARHPDATFAHTAGSVPMGVFEGHARHYGVFYPMQTFSKSRNVDFSAIPCFVEASDETARHQLLELAQLLSRRVYELDSERRKHLHLAAVFACNFANHCYALAAEQLAGQDIPFDVMLPLIDETAQKVHQLTPQAAQTGPAVRYDRQVLDRQKALIADPLTRDIYESLSLSIHRHHS